MHRGHTSEEFLKDPKVDSSKAARRTKCSSAPRRGPDDSRAVRPILPRSPEGIGLTDEEFAQEYPNAAPSPLGGGEPHEERGGVADAGDHQGRECCSEEHGLRSLLHVTVRGLSGLTDGNAT